MYYDQNAAGPSLSPEIEMLKMPFQNDMGYGRPTDGVGGTWRGGGPTMDYGTMETGGRPIGPGGYGTMEQMMTKAAAPWSGGMNAMGGGMPPPMGYGDVESAYTATMPGWFDRGTKMNAMGGRTPFIGRNDPWGGGGMNAFGGAYQPPMMGGGQQPWNPMGQRFQNQARFNPQMGMGPMPMPGMSQPMGGPQARFSPGMGMPQQFAPQQPMMNPAGSGRMMHSGKASIADVFPGAMPVAGANLGERIPGGRMAAPGMASPDWYLNRPSFR